MNNGARDNLAKMVKSYGVQICNTPKTCEIFLKQQCGDYPEELEVLTKALREGSVGRLIKHKTSQPWEGFAVELIRDLVGSGMREDEAAWAVDSWAMALGKHPTLSPPPPEPERIPNEPPRDSPPPSAGMKLTGNTMVAIGGGGGGAAGIFFAIGIMILLDNAMPTYLPERWMAKSAQDQFQFYRLIGLIIVMAVAGLCGATGGFFGWMLGGGEPQMAWKGALRAFGAAFLMAAVGCHLRFAIIIIPVGTLVASAGAALSVAFIGDAR